VRAFLSRSSDMARSSSTMALLHLAMISSYCPGGEVRRTAVVFGSLFRALAKALLAFEALGADTPEGGAAPSLGPADQVGGGWAWVGPSLLFLDLPPRRTAAE